MTSQPTYDPDTLPQRIADGNEQAFAQFYHHYYSMLYPFVREHVPTTEDTEEVLQHTFLRVWLNRDKLPEIENVRAWIYKIASREYLTHVRDRVRRRVRTVPLPEGELLRDDADLGEEPLSLREIEGMVAYAVERLSPQRRAVFVLSRREHLSIEEIAERLQLSPKTVKNTLTAALGAIREHLAVSGYSLGILILLGYL